MEFNMEWSSLSVCSLFVLFHDRFVYYWQRSYFSNISISIVLSLPDGVKSPWNMRSLRPLDLVIGLATSLTCGTTTGSSGASYSKGASSSCEGSSGVVFLFAILL